MNIADKFTDQLMEQWRHRGRSRSYKTKKSFSPSAIGYGSGRCSRRWYIAFGGADWVEEQSPSTQIAMEIGILLHKLMQEVMGELGITISIEEELLWGYPPIRAYCDGIVEIDGVRAVVEIKTAPEVVYEWHKASGKVTRHHLLQTLVYMKILGLDHGIVYYINKSGLDDANADLASMDSCAILIKMTDENRELVDGYFAWMEEVWNAWTNDTLPMRGFRKGNKICAKCPVLETCESLPKGDVKIRSLEVAAH